MAGGNHIVEYNDIHDNTDGLQIQYRGTNNTIVRNNKLHDNQVWGVCIDMGPDNTLVYNNLIYNNGNNGIYLAYGTTNNKIYNNTIYNNGTIARYGGILIGEATNTTIKNNIIWGNTGPVINDIGGGSGTVFSNNLTGIDPMFVSGASYDFHLQAGSPAIDGGAGISVVSDDYSGVSRPRGPAYDIGAYEY
jgi:parallel beta-helix repeat protein